MPQVQLGRRLESIHPALYASVTGRYSKRADTPEPKRAFAARTLRLEKRGGAEDKAQGRQEARRRRGHVE